MEFINLVLIGPILEMAEYPAFFLEVVFGGLMSGVMYSLVALGFVLIFKASGVFNFGGVCVVRRINPCWPDDWHNAFFLG